MLFSLSPTALVVGLAGLGLTSAHAVMDAVYVNGQPLGHGTAIRLSKANNVRVDPIGSLTSNDMACGVDGDEGVARSAPIKGNDVLTFQWMAQQKTGNFPDSHKGPCSVMMKKVDDSTTAKGSGDGWFRIFYEGYNKETKKWCTSRVFNGGMLSVRVPADLATGDYLVRSELLALHGASNNDPQFYVNCLQAVMTNGGTAVPKDIVAIPSDGYAKIGTPPMNFNLYWPGDNHDSYEDYGPPTYVASGPGGNGPVVKQTNGLRPADAIFEAGNFHAFEVSTFTTSDECWASSDECFQQSNTCWKAILVNHSLCKKWADRCDAMGKTCKSNGPFPGPANAGKDLSPPLPKVNVPEPVKDAGVINSSTKDDEADETSSEGSSPSPASAPPSDRGESDSEYGSGSEYGSDDGSDEESDKASIDESDTDSGGGDADSSSTTVDAGASSPSSSVADAGSSSPTSSAVVSADESSVTPAAESSCVEVVTETVTETATMTVRARR